MLASCTALGPTFYVYNHSLAYLNDAKEDYRTHAMPNIRRMIGSPKNEGRVGASERLTKLH